VAIRERLAREAMSLQKSAGKSDYEPSTTKYESGTETLSRKQSDDFDEKDESSKSPLDLSILT
jgi:hypothetical protein